jgi:hypothetical protein
MKYRKLIMMLLCFLLAHSISSQTISKSVIGACGLAQSNGNNKFSWTIGEPIVGTMSAGGYQLGNGYYQSLDYSLFLSTDDEKLDKFIKVFPNPTAHYLFVEQQDKHPLEIRIFDLTSKNLLKRQVNSGEAVDVSNLSVGMYLLLVKDNTIHKEHCYKIIIEK